MMRALWTAASGMTSQQTNVDTIANNISNINTAGYKSEKAEFKSLLYQNLQSRSTNSDGTNKPVAAQVGLGTRTASITSNFEQGSLSETGAFMDWAIEGKGFYKVDTGSNGIAYTRNASFSLTIVDGGSMITTAEGYPVLDVNNEPMIIDEEYSISTLSISDSGQLYAENANGEKFDLGIQVGLAQFSNPAGLEKAGNSLFRVTSASGVAMEESTSNNLQSSKIHQGYLESSNVSAADEMVDLIVAQRAYEMNSKCITASDTMMQQANNLRGQRGQVIAMEISGLAGDLYNQYASIYNNTSTELNSALTVDADNSTDEELLDACKQFEQYFVEQVIKEMKKTLPEGSFMGDNEYASVYEDTYVQTMAEAITDSGQLGLAQQIYESMSSQAKALTIEELYAKEAAESDASVAAAGTAIETEQNDREGKAKELSFF